MRSLRHGGQCGSRPQQYHQPRYDFPLPVVTAALIVGRAVLAADTTPLVHCYGVIPLALDDYLRSRRLMDVCPRGAIDRTDLRGLAERHAVRQIAGDVPSLCHLSRA